MKKVRVRKVADQIRLSLSEILMREVRDPEIGFITITGVDLTSDLQYATVYISALSEDMHDSPSVRALRKATPFIRRLLAERIRLRHVPELRFVEDPTGEQAERIEELIDEIQQERPNPGEES